MGTEAMSPTDLPDPDPDAPSGPAAAEAPEAPPDPAADLPPVETIGPETDLAPWLRPGIPAALKNAALRRKWLTTPAIRDHVDPALDYAWDWNAAAVPGAGGRIAADSVAKMLRDLAAPAPDPAPATRPEPEAPAQAPAPDPETAPPPAAAQAPAPRAAPAAPPRRRHGGASPIPPSPGTDTAA